VATGYGSHNVSDLQAQINSYNSWYHVNGIFFDEMANTAGFQTYYSNISNYAKSHGLAMTVGNPGTDTLQSYIGTVDNMCIYESPGLPALSVLGDWHTSYPKSNFCMIAFGVGPPSQSYITSVSNYVSYIYITNENLPNPYDTVPPYIGNEVAMLDTGSTPPTVPQSPTVSQSPTNLAASTISLSQINLSWTAGNNGGSAITGYKVERSTDGGTTWSTIVDNTGSTATTYSDTGLSPSTACTYRVSAINSVGTSQPSNTSSATTTITNTVSITVNAVKLAGSVPIQGMWTELHASNGTILATGYTPVTFNVTPGVQYTVFAADFQTTVFKYWGSGNTNSSKTITPTQNMVLTAYYDPPAISVTVNSDFLTGVPFSGMWTELHASDGTILATGYTPVTFKVPPGVQYTVFAANFQTTVFQHWGSGSTNSSKIITPTQDTVMTAYYHK
jgi:hypothetical protein